MTKTIGVLTIQGDFDAHRKLLERLGVVVRPVLHERDLDAIDALVIPGGESTTISKGMQRLGLYEPLRKRIEKGLPVLGTCAGAILLSREVENHAVPVLGVLDVTSIRNAYGTQVNSFAATLNGTADGGLEGLRCIFIRAPQLKSPGPRVKVLAQVDNSPVFVQQGSVLATTFHPELADDSRVHARLLDCA
ncbi:MAG: pyridoxal 5'-phosphate synthase glutaminase subunit PdxT [Gammaproteobacteria bacterium]|nr:pyridoxal 5'-phosphate synthase glutaminase subunit PdxT [Gammaproteobacteria bacterium]MDH3413362.1 pyridoxal 5'-phosphate synthase glutaminase subunit PdxT [Gammaproteobacteria bacterium]